jgi:hypothetical protein
MVNRNPTSTPSTAPKASNNHGGKRKNAGSLSRAGSEAKSAKLASNKARNIAFWDNYTRKPSETLKA